MQLTRTPSIIKFTTLLTYSEITVAIAAPPMPIPKRKINIGSNNALSKLPAPAFKSHSSYIQLAISS